MSNTYISKPTFSWRLVPAGYHRELITFVELGDSKNSSDVVLSMPLVTHK